MAVDLEKAVQFVSINGNSFQKNYLKSLFGDINLEETLRELAHFQNADGGWIQLDTDYTGNLSSITCTMIGMGKLERLKVNTGSILDATITYLKKTQKPKGMWDESIGILDFQPPAWYYPKSTKNQIWFTNGILRYIVSVKPNEHEMITKARGYLRGFWDGSSFPSYDHNNWMGIVSFYNSEEPVDSSIWQGCMDNLRRDIRRYDLSDVNWVLESCCFLSIPRTEPVIAEGLERLIDGQAEDGGFATEYGESHRVDTTIEALDTLANYRIVPRYIDLHIPN